MHLFEAIVAFTSLIAHVSPKTIQVNVGQHGLSYDPDYIEANTGDKIQFNFYHVRLLTKESISSSTLRCHQNRRTTQ